MDYAGFLLRAITVLAVLLVVLITLAALKGRQQSKEGELEVRSINQRLEGILEGMQAAVLDKAALKKQARQRKQQEKQDKKNPVSKPRVLSWILMATFVLLLPRACAMR